MEVKSWPSKFLQELSLIHCLSTNVTFLDVTECGILITGQAPTRVLIPSIGPSDINLAAAVESFIRSPGLGSLSPRLTPVRLAHLRGF